MSKKPKQWRYHSSHSYNSTENPEIKVSMISQVYQTGIYVILNGDARSQFTSVPSAMANTEKKLRKLLEKGEIENLIFGREITVTTEDGFYKELKDAE